jgi:uncharacterized membrane protein YqaE (UPF0057 family)
MTRIRFNEQTTDININKSTTLLSIKREVVNTFKLKINPECLFLITNTGQLLTDYNICNVSTLDVNIKLKGGFIDALFNMLFGIVKLIFSLFKVIGFFITSFISVLEMLPLIFDPPRLIDDILFAITSSLNMVFKKMGGDVKNLVSSPEDDALEKGPFGVSNETQTAFTCMDPSWSMIMLLIICPPLAIIYKLGFGPGFISSIICGVLCVKLFYFPGLLFAILHVLC